LSWKGVREDEKKVRTKNAMRYTAPQTGAKILVIFTAASSLDGKKI
jgi:hypothetical protein